ncbi:amidase [Bradyrhizobium sp. U87765 SZCCT0131]|uniref:amidase n=1 Tax=unclassified Bradyrhizobium TaxID=2631580 RepID=UPI001BA9731C|nr:MULTISPECIES: amidase [unclassified Bradyrhizobium]MBR1216788.1 amidase [Bradyrhizobium sp. U87765 SZCCT0131]MBR1259456.1 amidase [Bradyrhizobium sp. U87765 SZCCT0134]MBR1305597.1 amidase [Bradyrhizobium sp. U87765 SZCCT0110]MBR1321964.1 amidase [Bradyrhizobium sp. U87765 SZCCT0109]MBR1350758.1 amidase [Bradyrhizobium sp. U87765 SZCCT0048]
MDPTRLTATQAAHLIHSGRLNPRDLLEACLARIADRDPQVRAMAFIDPALARATSALPGPLHGLPIGVKDVFDTADMPTEHGSSIWAGWRPKADAAAVVQARAAGAVVVGKTVTAEFAIRTPGPTVHPRTLRHTPGSSSSGSAAGVADGFFPLAFGTQAMGSLIKPAAYCGVVGYKPSFGMLPRGGVKPVSDTLDTVGVIARSVADCALFVGALSGADLGDPDMRPERAPRIGICRTPFWHKAQPETRALLADVATTLARAGADVVVRDLPSAFDAAEAAFAQVLNREAAQALGWELAHARDRISPALRDQLDGGLRVTAAAYAEAVMTLARLRDSVTATFDDLDVLVTPAATGQAPEGIASTGDSAFNWVWTALHGPAISVPAADGPDGLPLGIQVVARRGDDRAALAWSQWIAAALT